MMLKILSFLAVLFAVQAADAACLSSRSGGVPFNCDVGGTPSPSDLFLSGSTIGTTAGQDVSVTGAQLVGMDHSASPVTSTSGVTKNLAGWMQQVQSVTSLPLTIGGQAVYLGGSTNNQGNGSLIALATGTFTTGNCRQTDSNGNEVDSGAPCGGGGGGGGSGTVTTASTNQIAYYATSGTAVTGLATANSGVLSTSTSGVPSISTTLPSGLTIPTPSLTGTTTAGAINASGAVTLGSAASLLVGSATGGNKGAGTINATGIYLNGTALTNSGGLSSVTPTTPLAGAGTVASPLTCATCVTSTGGGALTATAPVTVSAAGLIAIGSQPGSGLIQWPSSVNVTNDTYYYALAWPWATGTITKVIYATGGTTPSFSATVQIAGTNVTGCSGLTVTSATATTATCTAANTITTGQKVTLVVSGVSGTPNGAQVQISYTRSAS